MIRGWGPRGTSCPSLLLKRYYTFVLRQLVLFFKRKRYFVLFFLFNTIIPEPSISAGSQRAKLTVAAFNSVYFSVRTRFARSKTQKFISCKYVQKETDLIYFVSLLEVYDVQECSALEYLLI